MSSQITIPEHLIVRIGGFVGPSYSVKLKGTTLIYTAWEDDIILNEQAITPAEEAWHNFRQELDDLGVWHWEKEYLNPGVMDGTQWRVEITWGEKRITSFGDNNFPIADGKPENEPEISPTFERFLEAVRKLISKLDFH